MIVAALVVVAAAAAPATPPPPAMRLVDEQRRPVAAARVRVWLAPAGESDMLALVAPLCDVHSDATGGVACSIPSGQALVAAVDAAAFAPLIARGDAGALRELVLAAGRTVSGVIAGPEGVTAEAKRDARLRATASLQVDELRRALEFERAGTIDADGRLAITGLPEVGGVSVRLDVPRFLPWVATPGAGETLRATLVPGVQVRGAVRDRRGAPVAGASVEVGAADHPPRAESDHEGRFELAVAQVPATLTIAAGGYRTASVGVTAADAEIAVVLDRGQGVRGIVLAGDGRPVERAALWFERFEEGRTQKDQVTLTLREGAFKVDLDEPGAYTLRFDAPGHRPEPTERLAVSAGEHLELGTLRLHTGAGAAGTTVDERDGTPVRGALVELVPQGIGVIEEVMYHRALRAVSDAEGRFEVAGAAEGGYLLRASAAGVGTAWRELDLAEDMIEQLGALPLGPGVAVTGAVTTRAGSPVAAASVRCFDAEAGALSPLAEATTDADGRFALRLAPGVYLVRVVRGRVLLAEQVEIGAAAREQEVDLVAPGVRLLGVVMRSGAPVAGGTLRLTDALDPSSKRGKVVLAFGPGTQPTGVNAGFPETSIAAEVGADGRFAVDDASVGAVRARYLSPDGGAWERELVVPDQAEATVVIDLDGATLSGAVVDDRAVPIAAAAVTLLSSAGEPLRQMQADADGSFRFADLQPGAYGLSGRADGYCTATLDGVAVAGDRPNQVTLALTPGTSGALAVRLLRAGGRPAAFVSLTLLDRTGRMVAALPTDSSGRREFRDLAAGVYVLAWSDAFGGAGASGELRVDAEAHARFERVLEPGVEVSLRCALADCPSVHLGALRVLTPLGLDVAPLLPVLSPRLRFGADGMLRLGALAPGTYSLQVLAGSTPYRRELTLSAGAVTVPLP